MTPGDRVIVIPPAHASEYVGTATVVPFQAADATRGCSRNNSPFVRVKYDPPWVDKLGHETVLVYTSWTRRTSARG